MTDSGELYTGIEADDDLSSAMDTETGSDLPIISTQPRFQYYDDFWRVR